MILTSSLDLLLQVFIEDALEETNPIQSAFDTAMIGILKNAYQQTRAIEKLYSSKLNSA